MKENKKTFDFVKNFKFTGLISIVLALTGLVGLLLAPFGVSLFNFDIDFVGGTTMQFPALVPAQRASVPHRSLRPATREPRSSLNALS